MYSFEKRKRAQELQAAKHLDLGSDNDEGGSGSSSESETEDEDAEMLTTALDLKARKREAIRRTLYILERYPDRVLCGAPLRLRDSMFLVFNNEIRIAYYPVRVYC